MRFGGDAVGFSTWFPCNADIAGTVSPEVGPKDASETTYMGKYALSAGDEASMDARSMMSSKSSLDIPNRLMEGSSPREVKVGRTLSLLAFPIRFCRASSHSQRNLRTHKLGTRKSIMTTRVTSIPTIWPVA